MPERPSSQWWSCPSLKYPPNPPTVGDPDTIDQRTVSYLLLMAFGVAAVFAALYFWRWVSARGFDGGKRFLAVAGLFVALVGLAYLVFPTNPDPIRPPNNEAAPALVVAEGAPPDVLEAWLDAAKVDNDGSLRDPDDPSEELDLSTVDRGEDLVGTPVAVASRQAGSARLHDAGVELPGAVPRRARR